MSKKPITARMTKIKIKIKNKKKPITKKGW
jgi:hypothetical protein